MVEVGSALLVVLGTLALLRALLQMTRLGGPDRERRSLRVVERCVLGTRQRLHLVELDGEQFLIGTSESGIQLLRTLGRRDAEDRNPIADSVNRSEESDSGETQRRPISVPNAGRMRPSVRGWLRASWLVLVLITGVVVVDPSGAAAQEPVASPTFTINLDGVKQPDQISSTLEIVALLTLVSVAPSILLMATCFTRIVIVFALLRQAIGIHQLPPNQVMVGLALFTTLFVMAPVGEQIRVAAYEPYVVGKIDAVTASKRAIEPVRSFLLANTRESDLDLFLEISKSEEPTDLADVSLTTILPAFMISELRKAFEIGFMIYLPFLVIDLVISSMLISMGMIVLPPMMISLPFKLMLFVLVDGWRLIVGSLVGGLQ